MWSFANTPTVTSFKFLLGVTTIWLFRETLILFTYFWFFHDHPTAGHMSPLTKGSKVIHSPPTWPNWFSKKSCFNLIFISSVLSRKCKSFNILIKVFLTDNFTIYHYTSYCRAHVSSKKWVKSPPTWPNWFSKAYEPIEFEPYISQLSSNRSANELPSLIKRWYTTMTKNIFIVKTYYYYPIKCRKKDGDITCILWPTVFDIVQ